MPRIRPLHRVIDVRVFFIGDTSWTMLCLTTRDPIQDHDPMKAASPTPGSHRPGGESSDNAKEHRVSFHIIHQTILFSWMRTGDQFALTWAKSVPSTGAAVRVTTTVGHSRLKMESIWLRGWKPRPRSSSSRPPLNAITPAFSGKRVGEDWGDGGGVGLRRMVRFSSYSWALVRHGDLPVSQSRIRSGRWLRRRVLSIVHTSARSATRIKGGLPLPWIVRFK